ncbi:zinc finger, CCHC-type containing protein [Tanacetum coccineum]
MHSMGKTIAELHAMLKLHEKGILKKAKIPAVLAIREGKIQKNRRKPRGAKGKDKGKNKLAYAPKPKILPPPKRDNQANDSICHHYKEVGYWRRNCPSYQAELKKRKKASMDSTSGIFTIELYAFSNKTWGYALESVAHILNMVPTKKVERMPYNIWQGKAPMLSYLRVWGCEALVKRDAPEKLDPRSIKLNPILVEVSVVRIYQKSQENRQKRASTDTRIRRVQKEAKDSKPKPEKSSLSQNQSRKVKVSQRWSNKVKHKRTNPQNVSLWYLNSHKSPKMSPPPLLGPGKLNGPLKT